MAEQAPSEAAAGQASVVGYVLSGGVAAGVNFGSRFLFSEWLFYEAAVVAAYLLGMVTAFVLMRRYAFRPTRQDTLRQVMAFVAINALAVLQTVLASAILVRVLPEALGPLSLREALAHGVGVVLPIFTSFFGHRYLTFR